MQGVSIAYANCSHHYHERAGALFLAFPDSSMLAGDTATVQLVLADHWQLRYLLLQFAIECAVRPRWCICGIGSNHEQLGQSIAPSHKLLEILASGHIERYNNSFLCDKLARFYYSKKPMNTPELL